MPTPREAASRVLHTTTSLCRTCQNGLPAEVRAEPDGSVWMHKSCPRHGAQPVNICDDADWYERNRKLLPPPAPPRYQVGAVQRGCPFDCGPCQSHQQRTRLPVITITSACNLACPICFVYNQNHAPYHMSLDEFRSVLGHLKADRGGTLDIVNITGGEPLLHPQILELLQVCKDEGVHRVSVCSNGLPLVRHPELLPRLAQLEARIALSFDTFDPDADILLQGVPMLESKLRCLDLLEQHGLDTTLIPVMTPGVNDHEIGRILELALLRPNIRHLEVHTITYTGQGGTTFARHGRMGIHEVLLRIEAATAGQLRPEDFLPSPCAHPLCYQIAYLLMDPDGGPPIPFTRFLDRRTFYDCLGEHLYLEPSPRLERALQEAIDRLWTEGGPDADRALGLLNRLLRQMFPAGRALPRAEALRVGERAAKAIYVHSHMDEDNFDTERLALCCDSNCYPDGSRIPVCASNVLYRSREPRFNSVPLTWPERSGGRPEFHLPVLQPQAHV